MDELNTIKPEDERSENGKKYLLHLLLFVVTLACTTIAGAEWMFGKSLFYGDALLSSSETIAGLYFSLPFLGILSVHEFGHYFTARYHKVKVTLPFYIPLWLGFLGLPSIGTMGAFIRIKDIPTSRKQYFDIGLAGPMAGFVVALAVLFYGFTHLPEPEYIFKIHPEYQQYGLDYAEHVHKTQEMNMVMGDNLIFLFFEKFIAEPSRVPNQYEMYHYPWIFAGYLALFFTALNLIPIGQLDGGHVIYGLFGHRKSRIISRVLFLIMVTISGVGIIPVGEVNGDFLFNAAFYLVFLYLAFYKFEPDLRKRLLLIIWIMILQIFMLNFVPEVADYGIYMMFAFLLGRFLGIDHPKAIIDQPLDLKRKIIGWIALIVFVISFTPRPIYIEFNKKARIEQPGPEKNHQKDLKVITRRMIEIN